MECLDRFLFVFQLMLRCEVSGIFGEVLGVCVEIGVCQKGWFQDGLLVLFQRKLCFEYQVVVLGYGVLEIYRASLGLWIWEVGLG